MADTMSDMACQVTVQGILVSFALGLGFFMLIFSGWALGEPEQVCSAIFHCTAWRNLFPFSVALFASGVGGGALMAYLQLRRGENIN